MRKNGFKKKVSVLSLNLLFLCMSPLSATSFHILPLALLPCLVNDLQTLSEAEC